MTLARGTFVASLLIAFACGPSVAPGTIEVRAVQTALAVAPQPGFGDPLGSVLVVDPAGAPLRVRADGVALEIESHPGNPVVPGAVRAIWPLGPRSALVASEAGLYVAQSGWLIAPPWRDAVSAEGVVGAVDALDGTAWIGHRAGLYRLADGRLSELRLNGAPADGSTQLAFATDGEGRPSLWIARDGKLTTLTAVGGGRYEVRDHGLPGGKEVRALVGLGASAVGPPELWLLTDSSLHRFVEGGWHGQDVADPVTALVGAGRQVWVLAGPRMLRFDADVDRWDEVQGLPAGTKVPLAVDAAGTLWLSIDGQLFAASTGPVPRVVGLDQNQKVFTDQLVVTARFPGAEQPEYVAWQIDEGDEVLAWPPEYSFAGLDHRGNPRPAMLATLTQGLHTLTATAAFVGRPDTVRTVPFEYRAVLTELPSYAEDIRPIYEARCDHCHGPSSTRPLDTYERFRDDAAAIAAAVGDRRMPADGPLDPELILKVQRWVAGGMPP